MIKSPKNTRNAHIIPQISYTLPDDESSLSSIASSVFSDLDLNNSGDPENEASAPDVDITGSGPVNDEIEHSSSGHNSPIQLAQGHDYRPSRAPDALAYLEELKDYHQRFLKNRSKRSAIQDVPYGDVKELLNLSLVCVGLILSWSSWGHVS